MSALLIAGSPSERSRSAALLDAVAQRLTVRGVDFWVVDGQGFRFQPFRDQVLAQVAREFHDIPAWLPVRGNPFCERYGFADCAPGRNTGR